MSFDEYNRIRTTDMRLLRRMVRDSQFRSHDAETTLRTWSDVRDGEENTSSRIRAVPISFSTPR